VYDLEILPVTFHSSALIFEQVMEFPFGYFLNASYRQRSIFAKLKSSQSTLPHSFTFRSHMLSVMAKINFRYLFFASFRISEPIYKWMRARFLFWLTYHQHNHYSSKCEVFIASDNAWTRKNRA